MWTWCTYHSLLQNDNDIKKLLKHAECQPLITFHYVNLPRSMAHWLKRLWNSYFLNWTSFLHAPNGQTIVLSLHSFSWASISLRGFSTPQLKMLNLHLCCAISMIDPMMVLVFLPQSDFLHSGHWTSLGPQSSHTTWPAAQARTGRLRGIIEQTGHSRKEWTWWLNAWAIFFDIWNHLSKSLNVLISAIIKEKINNKSHQRDK